MVTNLSLNSGSSSRNAGYFDKNTKSGGKNSDRKELQQDISIFSPNYKPGLNIEFKLENPDSQPEENDLTPFAGSIFQQNSSNRRGNLQGSLSFKISDPETNSSTTSGSIFQSV